MSTLIYFAIPLFIGTMLLEWAVLPRAAREAERRHVGYESRDTRASLSMGLGNVVASGMPPSPDSPGHSQRVRNPAESRTNQVSRR